MRQGESQKRGGRVARPARRPGESSPVQSSPFHSISNLFLSCRVKVSKHIMTNKKTASSLRGKTQKHAHPINIKINHTTLDDVASGYIQRSCARPICLSPCPASKKKNSSRPGGAEHTDLAGRSKSLLETKAASAVEENPRPPSATRNQPASPPGYNKPAPDRC